MTSSLWVNFAWPSLKEDATKFVKYCEHCQKFKKARKTGDPWTIRDKHGKEHKLLCLTVIDLATRWIKIAVML
jgi:hypothetical protein